MKVVYRLSTKPEINLPIQSSAPSIHIDNAEVSWETSPEGKLNTVVLQISGQPLRFDERGVILSTYPELESLAYRLSMYIANCLLIQTGFDAIDPATVLHSTPELHAETPNEEKVLASHLRTVGRSVTAVAAIRGRFDPTVYSAGFNHSAAAALYADGVRVTSLFQKYDLFYKVVEYFFNFKDTAFDAAVSNHARQHDPRFCQDQIKALRILRNRCTHPHAWHGHANPEDLDAVHEVQSNLNLVQSLAKLLLQHPTS